MDMAQLFQQGLPERKKKCSTTIPIPNLPCFPSGFFKEQLTASLGDMVRGIALLCSASTWNLRFFCHPSLVGQCSGESHGKDDFARACEPLGCSAPFLLRNIFILVPNHLSAALRPILLLW